MTVSPKPSLKDILVVDDQPENLRVLTQLLTGEGYKVRKARDGKTALLAVNSRPPDLILLDILMPEMDGYQVCTALKADKKTRDIPVIFISALDDIEGRIRAFQVGGVDYINKPFHIEEVLMRIQVQLELYHHKKMLKAQNERLKKVIQERRKAEEELRLLHQAIAACSNGIIITDATQTDNPIIYVNTAFEKITGYSREEAMGRNPRFLHGTDGDQPGITTMRTAINNQTSCQVMVRNYSKCGELYWNEIFLSPVRNSLGKVTNFVGIQTDITARKKIEEALRRSEQKFASAFRASPDPITISTLTEGRYLEVNQRFCELTGYDKKEVIHHTANDLDLWVDPTRYHLLLDQLQQCRGVYDFELQIRTKSQEIKTLLLSAELIEIEQEICLLTIAKDITERQKIQEILEQANIELYRLANSDGLLQVANRRRFDETLRREWQRCYREQKFLSLIICDVDEFKRYNDHYKHLQGDDCLIQVAQTIQKAVKRPSDLVARYGGEEFAVILPDTDEEGAIEVAKKIRQYIDDLKIPHATSTVASHVTLSMGLVSLIPSERLEDEMWEDRIEQDFIQGKKTEQKNNLLIQLADEALFQAKTTGRNRIVVYGKTEQIS